MAEIVYLTKDAVQNKIRQIASDWNWLQLLHHLCNGGFVLGKMGSALLYDLGQGISLDNFGLLGSASNTHLRLFFEVHLEKKNSKTVDVHLWGVFVGKLCFRGCIG